MQTHVIPFHQDTITAVETNDGVFVALKPICERLGLSDRGQRERLNRRQEFWGGRILRLPSQGGAQETTCIPASKLAAWLLTIGVNQVKPELRDGLLIYQNEAADVLDRHFRHDHQWYVLEIDRLRVAVERVRAAALAHHPLFNRIARLQEAGCSLLALPVILRRSERQTEMLLDAMEDMGLIDPSEWTGAINTYNSIQQFGPKAAEQMDMFPAAAVG